MTISNSDGYSGARGDVGAIDWGILDQVLRTIPGATFEILIRNVEKTSDRILSELRNPATDSQKACVLAHELRGMLVNFALAGAGETARSIETSGGALSERESVYPRLRQEIRDGLEAVRTAARDRS